MRHGKRISEEEADRLMGEGAGAMFDLREAKCGGYFEPKPGNTQIVVITDDGYSVRSIEDLETGPDGVFVRFIEEDDGKPLPSVHDVFEIREL